MSGKFGRAILSFATTITGPAIRNLGRGLYAAILLNIFLVDVAHAQTPNCPQDQSGWEDFRDRAIAVAFDQQMDINGRPHIDYSRLLSVAASIREIGKSCLGDAGGNIQIPVSLKPSIGNFLEFFAILGRETDANHSFGMAIDDQSYIDSIRDVIELPALLRSQKFLQAISDRRSYKQAYDMVLEQNKLLSEEFQWIPLIYKSRFLTTPDQSRTFGRFFVLVPGKIDKWIQFGILTPEMPDRQINNLSIVAINRLPGHTTTTPKTESFIVDYWRTYKNTQSRDGQQTTIDVKTKLESGQGSENCSECHKTPVLGIHPAAVYRFDGQGDLVEVPETQAQAIPRLINKLIEGYGPPHYRGWQPQSRLGPAMGSIGRQRSDSFLTSCTAPFGVPTSSFGKIRKAMECAACHNDNLIGRINFPQGARTSRETALIHPDTGEMSPLVQTYVLNGWMPPGLSLSQNERKALVECLYNEYLDLGLKTGVLVDWLRGQN